jgi:hypothetical protein
VELSQTLDFVDGGEKVNEAATLAPSSHALFAKEFRDLLVNLEVASPEKWQGDSLPPGREGYSGQHQEGEGVS